MNLQEKSSELQLIDDQKFLNEMNTSLNNLLLTDKSFLQHSDFLLDPNLLENGLMVDELTELEVSLQSAQTNNRMINSNNAGAEGEVNEGRDSSTQAVD